MKHRIGICLSGCGVRDGSEIHEATLTLLAVDMAGAQAVCMAPNGSQAHVIDHRTGRKTAGSERNILTESARIARGDIRDLAQVRSADLDALILPGGFGATLNLSNFAEAGAKMKVHPDLSRLIQAMHGDGKPVAALCIAPVILAATARDMGIECTVTIGSDPAVAGHIEAMGQVHMPCEVDGLIVDMENRFVTTPAYMLARGPAELVEGIEKLVGTVINLINDRS